MPRGGGGTPSINAGRRGASTRSKTQRRAKSATRKRGSAAKGKPITKSKKAKRKSEY